MKAKCFLCGQEFNWEKEENYQPCEYCNGTGHDEVCNECIFCKGVGFRDINEDDVPICDDCRMRGEERKEEDSLTEGKAEGADG